VKVVNKVHLKKPCRRKGDFVDNNCVFSNSKQEEKQVKVIEVRSVRLQIDFCSCETIHTAYSQKIDLLSLYFVTFCIHCRKVCEIKVLATNTTYALSCENV
jgi:hypothetical protein